jgi:acyl-CoA thioester hydrolase
MPEWKMTYRGIIYPWHCDHMGHMNVMWYSGKFDEACWQLLAMLGLDQSRFRQDTTGMAAVEQHTQYRRELRAGDAITIHSALLEVKDKSIHMLHKMLNDATGEVAATTVVIGVYIDSRSRKATLLPEDVRQIAIEMKEEDMMAFKECVEHRACLSTGRERVQKRTSFPVT